MGININVPNQISQNTPLRTVRSGSTTESDYNVKYVPQTLTEEQQAQARENIGAAKAGEGGQQIQSDWTQTNTSAVDYIKNKPTIPAAQVNADWNAESGVTQILNKPTIPAAQVNADWNAESGVAQILNKPTIPAAQIQSDWNQTDTTALDYIKNKPAISEDIIEDKNDVITIYSDKETNITFGGGQMLDIWKNGVHTKLGNVGDNVRSVRLAIGKNVLKFSGIGGVQFNDKSGHYTIVCPLRQNYNTLLSGTYTGYVNIFYTGTGFWMNTQSGSTIFNMNNTCWQGMWTGSGDVVFVNKSMNSLNNGIAGDPTFLANYYVPKSRYNEFITKMETIFASSYIDILKTKVIPYDFLSIDPNYDVNMIIL